MFVLNPPARFLAAPCRSTSRHPASPPPTFKLAYCFIAHFSRRLLHLIQGDSTRVSFILPDLFVGQRRSSRPRSSFHSLPLTCFPFDLPISHIGLFDPSSIPF